MQTVLSWHKGQCAKRVGIFLLLASLIIGMAACTTPIEDEVVQDDLIISSTAGGSVTTLGEGTPPDEFTLTISSTAGGSVTEPGEGVFVYAAGAVVDLLAEADEGCHFLNWMGDVDAVSDGATAGTTITMDGNYSIVAGFIDLDVFPSSRATEYSVSGSGDPIPRRVIIDPFNAREGDMQVVAARIVSKIGVAHATCTWGGHHELWTQPEVVPLRLLEGTNEDGWWIGATLIRSYPPMRDTLQISIDSYNTDGDSDNVTITAMVPHPFIRTVRPWFDAWRAPVDTVVSVTFWEDMNASTIDSDSFTVSSMCGPVPGVLAYDSSTCTATFTPHTNLDYMTDYQATLTSAITCAEGRPLDPALSHAITTVRAPFMVSPWRVSFAWVAVGSDNSIETVTITNRQVTGLSVSALTLDGTDAGDFSVVNDNASGQTLPAGASATFEIVFSPTSPGTKSAGLSIASTQGTVIVALSGSAGEAPPDYSEIRDWHDLHSMRDNPGGHYRLMNHLDAGVEGYMELASALANQGQGWEPIGSWACPFAGTLDGQGYEIRDIFIHRPDQDGVGLFGYVCGGHIHDIALVNVDVAGRSLVGSMAGSNHHGTFANCHSTGSVAGAQYVGNYIGGIAGVSYGTVSESWFAGSVFGDRYVGGLVGSNRGTVRSAHSIGSVTGRWQGGGLVGQNRGVVTNSHSAASAVGDDSVAGLVAYNSESGVVSNSYAMGNVLGRRWSGGLVGRNAWGIVVNCYATGTVTRSSSDWVSPLGGFVGRNSGAIVNCYSTGSVHYDGMADPTDGGFAGEIDTTAYYLMTSNFWDTETSGQTSTAGEATGKTTTEMQSLSTFLDAGWDIELTTEANPTRGYPFLAWQLGGSPTWYISGIPTVTTRAATDVAINSATLNMSFTVGAYSPLEFRFNWREEGAVDWMDTAWVEKAESGTQAETITGLDSDTTYEFKAQLRYNSTVVDGATMTFTTAAEPIPTYDLTISSTAGGSVTTPGEGTYPYAYGTVVNLVATPHAGYRFVSWTGDVSTIANTKAATTTIAMDGEYSVTANLAEDDTAESVETATGTGKAYFTTSHGTIEDLEALPVPLAPPADIVFPHGMFSFKVTELDYHGQTVTITIELPEPVPTGTRWWKERMGAWYSIPVTVVEPNVISFTLTDGVFPGDSDKTEDGVITDPGGPGNPVSPLTVGWEGSPVSKAAVVAPWIALLAVMVGAGLLRRTMGRIATDDR